MFLLPADVVVTVLHADDEVAAVGGIRHLHARVLRFAAVHKHAVVFGQPPAVFQRGDQVVPVKEVPDPFPVFGVDQPVQILSAGREEILSLFLDLQLPGFPFRGKLCVMGAFTVNIIDQVKMGGQGLGNPGVCDVFLPVRIPGDLRPHFLVDVFNTDDNMFPVPGHDLRMPDMPDFAFHDQPVGHGVGIPVFQVGQHDILVVNGHHFRLVFGMHVLADASPALGKKVVSGRRYVQLFILICRRNFTVGIIL